MTADTSAEEFVKNNTLIYKGNFVYCSRESLVNAIKSRDQSILNNPENYKLPSSFGYIYDDKARDAELDDKGFVAVKWHYYPELPRDGSRVIVHGKWSDDKEDIWPDYYSTASGFGAMDQEIWSNGHPLFNQEKTEYSDSVIRWAYASDLMLTGTGSSVPEGFVKLALDAINAMNGEWAENEHEDADALDRLGTDAMRLLPNYKAMIAAAKAGT